MEYQQLAAATTVFVSVSSGTVISPPSPQHRMKRAHTKSRQGCFSCKIRRIKCQETKPACENCARKKLDCVYPRKGDRKWRLVAENRIQAQRLAETPSLSVPLGISTTPFTGDDLRFWHHFLVNAQPGLPIGDESNWSSEIPAFAHDCPHLLHALLSLGASYCSLTQGHQYTPLAIAHRGKALKALSSLLARSDSYTTLEMDSVLAASFALTFQARYMSDGVIDFAVMARGCSIITDRYFLERRKSVIFHCLQSQDQIMQTIDLPWEAECLVDPVAIAACIAALDKLKPLLRTTSHHTYYHNLRLGYISLLTSHRHAFNQITMIYVFWTRMDNSEFNELISRANHVARALFMHYITIDSFMRPVYTKLGALRNLKTSGGHFLIYRWAESIYNDLPGSLQTLVYDLFEYLACDLLPVLADHRSRFPQWNNELSKFVVLLRKCVPSHVLEQHDLR
ncbi:C6 zinc finger domain protein [Aspergillus pseudoustus]|uniref:C6 zinc finger domain protein n=1 Tax=Aspergillus pseudoustus TaxID=1810923 RepID=A0ABR4L1E5_9EURO